MKFKIIEGDEFYNTHKQEFIRLYKKGLSNEEMLNHFHITRSQYDGFRKKLYREGKLTDTDFKNRLAKIRQRKAKYYFYNKQQKLYTVKKNHKHYASFKSEEHAKRYVEEMNKINWDFNRRWEIREKILKQ